MYHRYQAGYCALFVLLLGFTSTGLIAQSSLYQDAKLIAEFLRASQPPRLVFDLANDAHPIIETLDGDRIELAQANSNYLVRSEGLYLVTATNQDSSHVLKLQLGDTLFVLSPFVEATLFYVDGVVDLYDANSLVFEWSGWQGNERFQNVEHTLAAHTDFDQLNKPGYRFSWSQCLAAYQGNPFLPAAWRGSPYLNDSWEGDEEMIRSFPLAYYEKYPWQRLLTGDSILQLKQAISFEEVNTTYRRPIITSRRALDLSSSRINETSRNRGLLDARTVASGLSDFIAERAQEELNLTFFHRFRQNLERPSELTLLFPNTRDLLFKFEISNYKTLLSHARTSFEQDLDNLGINFPKILSLNKYQALNNDPNVFNLSLIYSIADLAYKEYPVETILMAAHQILQERQASLQQSIHLQLADTLSALQSRPLLAEAPMPKALSGAIELPTARLAYDQLLDSLRSYTLNYLDSVYLVSFALEGLATLEVSQMAENERVTLQESYYSSSEEEFPLGLEQLYFDGSFQLDDIQQNINESYRYLELVGYQQGENIEYQNRKLDAYYTYFDHYRNVIPAHLSGNEYYGYILEQPRRGDHDQFFLNKPVPASELIAQGLDEVQVLLEREYAPKMTAFQRLMSENLSAIRGLRTERELLQTTGEQVRLQAVAFDRRFQLLSNAIDREISYWQTLTGLGVNNHYLAGLQYLRNYLHDNQEVIEESEQESTTGILSAGKGQLKVDNRNIWRIRQLAHQLTAFPDAYADIIVRPEFQPLQEDFSAELERARDRMDYIADGLEKQTALLVQVFGAENISAQRHQECLAEADREEAIQRIQEQDYFWARVETAGSDSLVIAPMLRVLENNVEYQQLIQEMEDIDQRLYYQDGWTDEQRDSMADRYEQISRRVSGIYEVEQNMWQGEYEKWLAGIGVDEYRTELNTALLEVDSTYKQAMTTAVESQTESSLAVRDRYSISDNHSLLAYRGDLLNEGLEVALAFPDIDALEQQLLVLEDRIAKVQTVERNLGMLLDSLASTFTPQLVRAKDNAAYLAKSIELSAHLLFAFRNHERQYDTLFYQDTAYIEVTNMRLDSLTGLSESFRYDSLLVTRRPVPGTTSPVSAARWLRREEFNALRTDELEWNVFMTLLYQRLNSVEDGPEFSPTGVALLATKFLQIANDVELNLNQLRRKKADAPDEVKFRDYYPFIRSTVDLFNTILVSQTIASGTDPSQMVSFVQQDPGYQPLALIPQISNEALSMYENIYVKDYGNAVLNAMELLKLIASNELDKKDRAQSGRAINAVLTYGTFMANMLNARSSDHVRTILQSATLPPGSSRIKREVSSNFTINSYLGISFAQDRLVNAPVGVQENAFSAALAVPIGVTYSFSPRFIKNKSSFSIHVPLLDLGAITAYRANPNNSIFQVNQLPEFSWQNLFSPGAFVVYNFANSPFSLGVGGQYGPQLREIEIETGDPLLVDSWRFPMLFFAVDVPFFNLHTGPRKIIVK
ncbi:MAG: hypothetical protein AAFN81_11770 [Bacteroidota bacterium]